MLKVMILKKGKSIAQRLHMAIVYSSFNCYCLKIFFGLLIGSYVISMAGCRKESQHSSIKLLLQNRWSVHNETTVLPYCSSADRFVYNGNSADFYSFKNNDTLTVYRSGTLLSPSTSIWFVLTYSLLDDNKLATYSPAYGRGDTSNIIKITNDSLIFVGRLSYSFLNLCTNTIMTGVAGDTLRLYR